MDYTKQKLDVVAIAIVAIVVGAMLTSSEFYGGWAGRICSVVVFIIAVLLGWRISNKTKGATLVLNYLLLWAILFYLQLVGFNLIEVLLQPRSAMSFSYWFSFYCGTS